MNSRSLACRHGLWSLFLTLATVSVAGAADPDSPPVPEATTSYGAQIVTGTVVSSDDGNLVLDTSDGHVHEFAFNESGHYEAAMFPGDDVRVYYETDPTRGNVVERVQTLNITQSLERNDRNEAAFAMSLPPTDGDDQDSQNSDLFAQASPTTTSEDTETDAQTSSRDLLPATASPIPGIGMIAMALLASAGAIRMVRSERWRRRVE